MSARQISNRAAVWWKTLAFVQSFPQSHRGCHMPSICLTGLDGFLNACGVEPNTFLCVWKSQGIKTDVALLTSYCPILSVILLQSISGRISWVSTLFLPLSHMLCFLLSIKRLWLLKQYFLEISTFMLSYMRRLIPLSCLYSKYEAEARSQFSLAYSIRTGNSGKQLT